MYYRLKSFASFFKFLSINDNIAKQKKLYKFRIRQYPSEFLNASEAIRCTKLTSSKNE